MRPGRFSPQGQEEATQAALNPAEGSAGHFEIGGAIAPVPGIPRRRALLPRSGSVARGRLLPASSSSASASGLAGHRTGPRLLIRLFARRAASSDPRALQAHRGMSCLLPAGKCPACPGRSWTRTGLNDRSGPAVTFAFGRPDTSSAITAGGDGVPISAWRRVFRKVIGLFRRGINSRARGRQARPGGRRNAGGEDRALDEGVSPP